MLTCNITEKEFKQLTEYIRNNYGINLSRKKALIVGRLHNFLIQNHFKNFSEYYEYVVSDKTGSAATVLINKLTTNHTYFMREADHFEYFKKEVLPYLTYTEKRKKDLRIWSAGCATGEEAYTLAMTLASYFGADKRDWDSKILATDISTRVLTTAAQGIYFNESIGSLSESWKKKYFKKIDNNRSMITDQIRNEVIFRKYNLMNERFPFKRKFHVIFCRNVMIYFDTNTRRELVKKFYDYTENGGYLFIGHSESLIGDNVKYKYIMPAVYRK
jgi:chemotaxis protein methyltransferase CheR